MKSEYQEAMSAVHMPADCEERVLETIERRERPRRRHPVRAAVLFAAAAVLLCGSVLVTGYQAGVLDFFFQGDTSLLEPYVQHPNSVSNGDYRFSVDSVLFDGRSLYAVLTIEGLNQQAVESLKSNQCFAEILGKKWGPEYADRLLRFKTMGGEGFFCPGMVSSGTIELPAPDESSRAWRMKGEVENWKAGTAVRLGTIIMGEDYMVSIQPELIQPLELFPNVEIPLEGLEERAFCTRFTLYMTGVTGIFQLNQPEAETFLALGDASLSLTLSNGQNLSGADLKLVWECGKVISHDPVPLYEFRYRFETPVDPSQIISVSFNGVELMS